jgi:flagellar protein FliO/FliZ
MTKFILLSRAATQVAAVLGVCLVAFACPAAALAASATKPPSGESTPLNLAPTSTSTHSSSGGASIVRTIVGLAIVIAVIWGLSWILRQVKAGRDPGVPSAGLASVAALTLGSGRSVHLVRAGNDYVLLGSAEQGLVPIQRYTEEQARTAGLLDAQEPPRPRRRLLAGQLLRPAGTGESELASVHRDAASARSGQVAAGHRPDPMRMPSPSSGLIERLREWTVRR